MAAALAAAMTFLPVSASAESIDTQPPNSIGVRLVDIRVDRADDPRAQSAIIDHVIPGGTISRRIEIVSTIAESVRVQLGAENAQIADGAFVPDSDVERGPADWVSVTPSSVELGPNESAIVDVTISVPASTPTSEYYAIVLAQPPSGGDSVSVQNRVGIRVYLTVGSGAEPPVDFAVGSMTAGRDAAGVPYVATQLRNTGGRALDIGGRLDLAEGPAGLAAGPFPFDGAISLLPGEARDLVIPLDPELPDGPWLATITAFAGLLERTAEARIEFPSDSGEEAEPEESEIIGGTDEDGNDISDELRRQRRALLPLAALLILLAIGALWLMLLWRRRQEEEDEDADNETAEVVHDG